MKYAWTCGCCGKAFDVLPKDCALRAPTNWFGIPERERDARAKLSDDFCIIDGSEYYVRGCLEVPVHDSVEPLVWGVWVSISKRSLERVIELWGASSVPNEPPLFGWLCNWINGYPEPVGIRCHVYIRPDRLRPRIELEPATYPLAIEQQQGISLELVKEIAARSGHVYQ